MYNESFIDCGIKYVRVNKTVASRLYKDCKRVFVFGNKQRRDLDYVSLAWNVFEDDYKTFDKFINAWCFYNRHIYGYPIYFVCESDL